MFPGPYAVCRVEVEDASDIINFFTLRYGYDSVEQAESDFEKISREFNVPLEELAVVRSWFYHDLVR